MGSWTRSQKGPQGLPRAPAQPFLLQGAFFTHPSKGALPGDGSPRGPPQEAHSLPAATVPSLPGVWPVRDGAQGLTSLGAPQILGGVALGVGPDSPGRTGTRAGVVWHHEIKPMRKQD